MTELDENPWAIKRVSPVHGAGVFAARDIPAGTAVLTCGGREIAADQVPGDDMRVMQIGPALYLAEEEGVEHLDNYLNHSCEPNLGFTAGTLTLFALRDINEGEELFWDYSTSINEPGWRLPCRCGTPSCRGVIQSFCDLQPQHKRRLRGIALAYLRKA